MESSDEFPIRIEDPEPEKATEKTINWIYEILFSSPLIMYTIIIAILWGTMTIEFLKGWQIWSFLIAVPILGFIGGFFLRKGQRQKSLFWASLFLVLYTALMTSGLTGVLDILQEESGLQIFLSFIGGFLYGSGFGLVCCIFLILASLGSYGLSTVFQRKK